MRRLLLWILAGMALPAGAQIPLSAPIYGNSAGSTLLGDVTITMTNATCNVLSPGSNCTLTGVGASGAFPWYHNLNVVGTLSAGQNLILPLGGSYVIRNGTAQALTVGGTSGATVVVAAGTNVAVNSPDATNYYALGASGVAFATNSTPNLSQTALNLVAGANVTLSNVSGGTVSIATAGGVSSSANIYAANSQVLADSILASAVNGYEAFGDSQTVGFGATTGYPALVAADIGAAFNNYAYIGDSTADMVNKLFFYDNPGDSGNPIKTAMIGTNDVLAYGTGGLPTVEKFLYAGATWEAASSTNKVLIGSSQCTPTGSWSANTQYAFANGLTSSTAANTLSCSVVVGPSGVFYLDYLMYTTNGTFTVKVDGTLATDTIGGSTTVSTSYAGAPPVNSGQPSPHGIYTVGAARYATTPGTHTVLLTVASGSVTPLLMVFPPVTRYRGISAPRYNFMNISVEGGLVNNTAILAYNAAYATWQSQMVTDGFNVPLLDTYNALDSNLDFASSATQNCPAGTATPVHSNQCGQQHYAQLVERAIGAGAPAAPVTTDALVGNGTGGIQISNTANPVKTIHSIWTPNRDNQFSGGGVPSGIEFFDFGITGDFHAYTVGYGTDADNFGTGATVTYGTADFYTIQQCLSGWTASSTCTKVAKWNSSGALNHPGAATFGGVVNGTSGFQIPAAQAYFTYLSSGSPFGVTTPSGAGSTDLFAWANTGESVRLGFDTITGTNPSTLTMSQPVLKCTYATSCVSTYPWDFSGASGFTLPVIASYTTSASGQVGYNSTDKNWHINNVLGDNILALFLASGTYTNGHLAVITNNSGVLGLGDGGAPPTSIANLSGGALGSAPYQSAANTTAFISSPTTSGQTFFYGWQPTGSAIAPTAVSLTSLFALGGSFAVGGGGIIVTGSNTTITNDLVKYGNATGNTTDSGITAGNLGLQSGANSWTGTNNFTGFNINFNSGLTYLQIATLSNCASSLSPAVCGSAPAGAITIAASASTITVNTAAVTANSEINVQPDETLGTRLGVTCNTTLSSLVPPVVTARTAGTSFTLTTTATILTNPACYTYTILN